MNQSDAALRDLVSTAELEASVAHLCAIGEKVSGTEEERKACDFITSRLKAWGYTPTVHTFESYISAPRSARLAIHAGGKTITIPAVGVAFGLSTGPDGITEDVVLVGAGQRHRLCRQGRGRQDRAGEQAPLPATMRSPPRAHGARGMICMSAGKQRHKMIITPVWGTPEFDQAKSIPRVHVVSIARDRRRSGDRDVKSRPGARDADRRHLRGLAHGAAADLRDRRQGAGITCWRARIIARGSTARPTTSPAMLRARARPHPQAVRRQAALRHPLRLVARPLATAAIRARPGTPTRSGTICATTRSRISTSTARA